MYCLEPPVTYNLNDSSCILLENIRQKCIYDYAYDEKFKTEEDDFIYKYWSYMENFYNNCIKAIPIRFTNECAEEQMKKVDINSNLIEKCIVDSFKLSKIILMYYCNMKQLHIIYLSLLL